MKEIINDDALTALKKMKDNSVDALITDPPAGISFMNKQWDDNKGGSKQWIAWMEEIMMETLRVLKPGAHGLVWALPRTSHWTATALENAGFEIRDSVYHLQAQGFPKSLNVSKGIDKKMGAKREVVGENPNWRKPQLNNSSFNLIKNKNITAPSTPKAKQYDGYGSQLKPAIEVWWLVRKPLSEKSIVDNVLKWGTGGLNIDKSRIPTEEEVRLNEMGKSGSGIYIANNGEKESYNGKYTQSSQGRFPSHFIHDGSPEVMAEFEKYGESKSKSGNFSKIIYDKIDRDAGQKTIKEFNGTVRGHNDNGTIARFFYCAKTSVGERNLMLDDLEDKNCRKTIGGQPTGSTTENYLPPLNKNNHPTVKPVKLMNYLVNLIAPPYSSVILDPFMGSGSTGIAALLNGHDFIGIELDEDYFDIATRRINNYEAFRKYIT